MIDVELMRSQATNAYQRAQALTGQMRAAQHRLLYRTRQADRTLEVAARRKQEGSVPAEAATGARRWTAWIATGPEDR